MQPNPHVPPARTSPQWDPTWSLQLSDCAPISLSWAIRNASSITSSSHMSLGCGSARMKRVRCYRARWGKWVIILRRLRVCWRGFRFGKRMCGLSVRWRAIGQIMWSVRLASRASKLRALRSWPSASWARIQNKPKNRRSTKQTKIENPRKYPLSSWSWPATATKTTIFQFSKTGLRIWSTW